ncbi:DUF4274 domain-containing protein [Mariniblastus sp.]|nr:DUF4274 domain-containing protein [Mariniblastus sp.]
MVKRIRKRTKAELKALESEFERRDRAVSRVMNASMRACKSVTKSKRKYIHQIVTGDWMDGLDPDIGEFEALELWDRQLEAFLRECANPFELHLFVNGWNWDDGGEKSLRKLVKNDSCDAGTALLLYWMTNPEYYLEYRIISDCPEHNREPLQLSRFIEGKFKRDGFSSRLIPFDPTPWITNEYDDYAVRKIPAIMFDPIVTTRIRKKK